MDVKLDFDDVLIVPQFSDITSRNQVELTTSLTGCHGAEIIGVPIISRQYGWRRNIQYAQFLEKV